MTKKRKRTDAVEHPAPADVSATTPLIGWAAAGVACAIAILVYLRTLARTLPAGDSGDLITAAWVVGVAHPPGFPLFTMLGHVFGLLPIGSPALRLNLLSAMLHAMTVGLTALCTFRLLALDRQRGSGLDKWPAVVSAVGGALLLAFYPPFWHYSLVAEVFALNSLFAILLLLLLFEWDEHPGKLHLFWAFSLACGLAATNHPTIVLLAPAFLVLIWSGARRLTLPRKSRRSKQTGFGVRHLLIAAAFLVLGLLPYVYLPLAARQNPPYNWGDPRTFDAMIRHILRKEYGTLSLAARGAEGSSSEHLGLLANSLFRGFTPVGWPLFAVGIWWLWRRRRAYGLALLLAFVVTGPVFVAYARASLVDPIWIGIISRFYILPSVPFAIAVGAGAFCVLLWAQRLGHRRRNARFLAPVLACSLALLTVASAVTNYSSVDQSNNTIAHDYGTDVLGPLEPAALLFMSGDKVTFPVQYLRLVENYRRDVIAVDLADLTRPAYVEQLRREHPDLVVPFRAYVGVETLIALFDANIGSRAVYMTFAPAEKEFWERFDLARAGLVERVLPKGEATDRYALLRQKADVFSGMRYPSRNFPPTSYEHRMAHDYGGLAFDMGYVLQNDADKARMYRTAIRLAPDLPLAYKNLGVILLRNGRHNGEVARLWEQYLALSPTEPSAAAIRRQIDSLRSAGQ